ncbi:uncharacterized protein [Odocoileus virginianus]|uniref:Uncharacterized protein n=1 Tax=Odocoileus virginianus TaxID=9874 RepID=A0ABM4IYT7_ODOVR
MAFTESMLVITSSLNSTEDTQPIRVDYGITDLGKGGQALRKLEIISRGILREGTFHTEWKKCSITYEIRAAVRNLVQMVLDYKTPPNDRHVSVCVCVCVCAGVGVCWGGRNPCSRSEPLVPTRRVSHRTVAKTSPQPRGSEESRPKAPARASALGRTPARAAERSPPPGSQLPLKFAVAAASSRFNPRPPVIGQLLRGKKSTPWQPDKPIKSPAGVTAATLQAGVGWAEEQSGRHAQRKMITSFLCDSYAK